jgi:hypothetical protein
VSDLGRRSSRVLSALAGRLSKQPRLVSFLIYLAFSAVLFGRAAAPRFNTVYLGSGIDQAFFVWCLVWWPYAAAHRLNPFITKLIFAPAGFNLAWSTSIPLISILAYPLTSTIGPIATFNLLCIVFPPLSAWTAYLLCDEITGRFWPSMMGGYIFGFSSYMLAQMYGGHVNLLAIFPIPLAVFLVIKRLRGRVGPPAFTFAMLGLLAAQFLTATEVMATATIFGAFALLITWILAGHELRRRIAALAMPILIAYAGTALVVSPYIYYLFAGFRTIPIYSASFHSADLLNFVVPTRTAALGRIGFFARIAREFTSNVAEQGGYIGVPLVVIAIWFTAERWRATDARLLASMLLTVAICAMGPWMHVAGASYVKLPWILIGRAPFLNEALPLRFTAWLFLAAGVIAAIWLADSAHAPGVRAIAAALAFASILPSLSASTWSKPGGVASPPVFFTSGAYRHYLAPDEVVATLPYAHGETDAAMMWQALTGMYFRLAGGYPALSPLSYLRWPAVRASNQAAAIPDPAGQWKAFAANHGVAAVIKGDLPGSTEPPGTNEIAKALGEPLVAGGGVTLYRVSSAALAPYRGLGWQQMETLADLQRFDTMLIAAQHYVASGADPAQLSPKKAAKLGLLPARWVSEPPRRNDYRLYMRADPAGLVTIGLMGTESGLRPLIERYRPYAIRIEWLSSRLHGAHPPPAPEGRFYYPLMISFDRNGLASAATSVLVDLHRVLNDPK